MEFLSLFVVQSSNPRSAHLMRARMCWLTTVVRCPSLSACFRCRGVDESPHRHPDPDKCYRCQTRRPLDNSRQESALHVIDAARIKVVSVCIHQRHRRSELLHTLVHINYTGTCGPFKTNWSGTRGVWMKRCCRWEAGEFSYRLIKYSLIVRVAPQISEP